MAAQFGSVLRISWARVILTVVFLEGLIVYSAFAYAPSHLHLHYQLSLWQAGLAAAGFGIGGLCYSLAASHLIRSLGERGLLLGGSSLFALGMFCMGGPSWPVQLMYCTLMGLGFFMVHNTLQVQATQMSPQARGTGIAAFAAGLFSGQSIGVAVGSPVLARFGFEILQMASAGLFLVLGASMACLLARRLNQPSLNSSR
jgi:predicted MFS family arabinose efflux permease